MTSFDGWTYTYDTHNRLITANANSKSLSLEYDPTGRLAKTTYNGTANHYLYDGDELVAEYNSSGVMTYRYVHGIGNDDPLVLYVGSGTSNKRYLLADERGSIITETSTTGAVSLKHQYGPFGEPINSSSSRFRYTGQIILPGTELYHYKARVYHPKLGRFLQTDPIGYEDQINLYAYVGSDPMNMIDPSGKTSWPVDKNKNGQVVVTSQFGKRNTGISGASSNHPGTDFRAGSGADVKATENGIVTKIDSNSKAGNYILISNDDGSMSGHAHTDAAQGMKVGDKVSEGSIIGSSDGSGTGNAPHQHYTYREGTPSNPATESTPKSDPMTTQFKNMPKNEVCVKSQNNNC